MKKRLIALITVFLMTIFHLKSMEEDSSNGVNIDAHLGPNNEPAIVIATRNEDDALVKILMENGADVNAKTARGWTAIALDNYLNGGHGRIEKFIRESGKLKVTAQQNYCNLF